MIAFALAGLVLAAPLSPEALREAGAPGLKAIRAESFSASVRFLADDTLEGRGTGSRGYAIAARWMASEFQALGAVPAGEGGEYLQRVPLMGKSMDHSKSSLTLSARGKSIELATMDEALLGTGGARADEDLEGPLVFVGTGTRAPELGYDDTQIDVKGKIAVLIGAAPSAKPFDAASTAVYSDGPRISHMLADRGALGFIVVVPPSVLKFAPWKAIAGGAAFERMAWTEGGKPQRGSPIATAAITPEAFAKLLALAGRPEKADALFAAASAGTVKPFALDAKARIRAHAALRTLESENVVGLLRGQGALAKELVVISAHLDHLGIGAPVLGDRIYNGASDNASGSAGLVEIGRAFAALPPGPRRSILLLAVTGEEKGLLGSDYFAHHPTVDLGAIAANVNIDGVGWDHAPLDLVAMGAEHSTLLGDAQAATKAMGLALTPDQHPEAVFFIRSDQYSFVQRGIPSVFLSAGSLDEKGNSKGWDAEGEHYFAMHYHQPSDQWDSSANYESSATELRADFLVALAIALDPERPAWNEGDVFAKMFGRRR